MQTQKKNYLHLLFNKVVWRCQIRVYIELLLHCFVSLLIFTESSIKRKTSHMIIYWSGSDSDFVIKETLSSPSVNDQHMRQIFCRQYDFSPPSGTMKLSDSISLLRMFVASSSSSVIGVAEGIWRLCQEKVIWLDY